MYKFIIRIMCIILVYIAGCSIAKAQTIKVSDKTTKEGNVFIQTATHSVSASSDDQATTYKWRDNKGNEYPIVLHKYAKGEKAGKITCYVVKKSEKTGKDYKYYLPDGEKIAETILQENI